MSKMKHNIPIAILSLFTTLTLSASTQTILTDIQTIKTDLSTLQAQVEAFSGSNATLLNALNIKTAADKVDKDIQTTTSDTSSSAPFSDTDSASIASSISSLQVQVFDTIDALVAKKESFTKGKLGIDAVSIVHDELVMLRQDTGYFGANVTEKLTPELRKAAPLLVDNIDFHFVRGVQAFESS